MDATFLTVAILIGGAIGAVIARFLDKSSWRDVAESRGAENEDLRRDLDSLRSEFDARVSLLEAQIEGLIALKSEQIAHLVLKGIQDHRDN